ncbi:MAG: hypothetical protein EPO21_23805 [Chloroflexota bacterium]|nr:MAG: hypothetical protein EPO21_23805 [Chloroflexota bacterium]
MRVKWKLLQATTVLALLVAGLVGSSLAGTVSADGKQKASRAITNQAPAPTPTHGPSGQPFILVFD